MPCYLSRVIYLSCLVFSLLLGACSKNTDSPETQIRHYIEKAIQSVENREYSTLPDMIANNYRDQKGLNKQQILNTLKASSLRHKNIYLLSKINSIQLQQENRAFVVIDIAMTGSRINDISSLGNLAARTYRFELQLIKQDDWQLQQAFWRKIEIHEMLE